jgi:glyoxylase-like metal-dependent hydrolase (beta-lactamase superfamily II)
VSARDRLVSLDACIIIVDAGFESAEAVTLARLRCGFPSYMRLLPEWEIPAVLAKVGRNSEDIDIVIVTHCHYDHVGGNKWFARARFFIHRNEIPLALALPRMLRTICRRA